jgi:hypothetical protein
MGAGPVERRMTSFTGINCPHGDPPASRTNNWSTAAFPTVTLGIRSVDSAGDA